MFAAEADAENMRAEDLGEAQANTWEARNARHAAGHASDLAQTWALIAVAAELHELNRIMRGTPKAKRPLPNICHPLGAEFTAVTDA